MNFLATLLPLLCLLAVCFASLVESEQQQPAAYSYDQFLEEAPVKRAQTFVRFGKRAQTFVRFGRSLPARYETEE
ncbi:hypothetical protein PFISCL1PPCAC_4952 [Pristionchus fissidentatus]|uniref:Uncharacterized protein n=1 Tax=Pristionchus fissidentatus TaxID=1538716 RepID=A0AAV5V259_9BILA|nr:hypothetical protein PFISCL1PPCAC_4952 [Pristionchus fissidentatus]